jgi:ABC-type Fe2+-enterobactin transport system substrate-binding protein
VFHIRASGDSPQATDALYREVLGLTLDKVPNTLQRSILSLRRDLSRCIWESIASGMRTGDSLLTWLSSSLHPSATG